MDPYILALMDDSLDAWLAEDWTASQGDELMPAEDENELLIAACRIEQEERKREQVSKAVERLLKHRDVIKIKKTDELCFARALVSIKAYVDKDPQYKIIYQGSGQQAYRAYKLHLETGVPKGPCGLPEIQKMQNHLGPQGYQIKVFERKCGVLWFCDTMYEDAPKKLCLLKEGDHFHGLRRAFRIVTFLASYPDPDMIRFGSLCY